MGLPLPFPPLPTDAFPEDAIPEDAAPEDAPPSTTPPRGPRVTRPADRNPPAARPPAPAPIPARRDLALAAPERFRDREVLVTVEGAAPDTVATQVARAFNLTIVESQGFALLENRRVYLFAIPDDRPVDAVVAAVSAAPGVTQSSPNFLYQLQGAGGGEAEVLQYALPKLHVPATQDMASGEGVTVAVIDSGVDIGHPALKEAAIASFDAVDGGVKTPDPHGTAIAGIIAGRGEISGIAPGAKLIAMRAFAAPKLGAPPATSSLALCRATDQAFTKGARVFNMSFAGPRDPLLLALIDAAHAKGAVFIAAAGNAGPSAPPAYPAAYDKVIGITATDEDDRLYAMANRGAYVSMAAPGVDILVPVLGETLDYMSGTSFAAAHITGIVALLRERNAALAPAEVRRILLQAARDLGKAGIDDDFGAGLADAYRALVMASPGASVSSSINP